MSSSAADSFIIDGAAYQRSFSDMWAEGPLPPDPMPMARIANVVTTGHLLPETHGQIQARCRRRRKQRNTQKRATHLEHSLDLQSVVRYVPAAKLNKRKFAAVVARNYRFTTALIFSTGSVVTVYAKSVSQGQYSCEAYKHILGNVPQLMVPEDTDMASWDPKSGRMPAQPTMTTLEGRMTFNQVWQENIVAYGYLGHPVDLEMIYCGNPNNVHYEPDQFPGLEWSAKVVDPQSGRETSVKNLIFRTGMWLVTGAQSYGIANEVYYRLRQLAHAFHETRDRHLPQGEVLKRLWLRLYEPAVQAQKQGLAMVDDLSHLNLLGHGADEQEKQVIASEAAMAVLNEKLAKREKARKKQEAKRARARRAREAAPKRKRQRGGGKKPPAETEVRTRAETDLVYSPLMIAATRGDQDRVKELLDRDADPAYVNAAGQTILELVDLQAGENYAAIKDMLLKALLPRGDGGETGI